MKKDLNRNELVLVGVMLFSLFFGAGNLIFPPFLGQEAGLNSFSAMFGFLMSAVGFPILGVIAVSKTNGLKNLAKRVGPYFASIYTILIYLSIGPLLGIPRAGSLPYEMVLAPFVSKDLLPHDLALFLFTSVFFLIAYILAMKPNKLLNRMGKVLTPALLILIALVFIASFTKNYPPLKQANGTYLQHSFFTGFLDGYQTMDTIAALNFGLVITIIIKDLGVVEEKYIIKNTVKAGLISGLILALIYSSLAYLGALSGAQYGSTENGAQTLANIIMYIFGPYGLILLASIFTLACLTTAVGLITSISQYFSSISKLTYKTWVRIFTLWSLFISNFGLSTILKISVPILNLIYPLALILIILSFLNEAFKRNSKVYRYSIYLALPLSLLKVLDDLKVLPSFLHSFRLLPLYDEGMSWLLPVAILVLVFILIERKKKA